MISNWREATHQPLRCFIGWDAAQLSAYVVAERSLKARARVSVDVRRLALPSMQVAGLYRRPTSRVADTGGLWDDISEAPMSTGHAIARFLVPALCSYQGWALFTDGDVLFRSDVGELLGAAVADPASAIHVVKHDHQPANATKMTGQRQTSYFRKNWSSVILWDCGHPANRRLTVEMVNTRPGRDLHRFCWLEDHEIGALPSRWNVLIGVEDHPNPAIAHFTDGVPDMPGYEDVPFADEWRSVAAAAGYRLEARA